MRRGERFTLGGVRYRVAYVNACRAHCVAVVKERRTLTTKDGETLAFTAKRRLYLDIAPSASAAVITEMLGGAR